MLYTYSQLWAGKRKGSPRQSRRQTHTHTHTDNHTHTLIWGERESTTLPTTLLNSLEKPSSLGNGIILIIVFITRMMTMMMSLISSNMSEAFALLSLQSFTHTHTRSTKFHAITTRTHTETACCRCCCFFADSLIKYLVGAHWQVCRHWQGPGSISLPTLCLSSPHRPFLLWLCGFVVSLCSCQTFVAGVARLA